jgi:bifunctional non-homologous end joining protein LigD
VIHREAEVPQQTSEVRAGPRLVKISRPDKLLFPADGITKADLVAYYRQVAPVMLPHLRGRALMMERYPDGVEAQRIMQKEISDYFPDWIHRAELSKQGGTVTHVVCDDEATLLYLANQACVGLHRWLSKTDRPDCPDQLIFDLDPSGDDFAAVKHAAGLLHGLLDELGLPSSVMTTGSRGLHVLVALDRHADFDEARAFAHDVADLLARRHPDRLTTEPRKQARGNRLYLDVQRNAYAQTAIAPYSVRPLPGAPVAAPLAWPELDEPGLTARTWTIATIEERISADPWRDDRHRGHALGRAQKRLAAIKDDS